MADELTGVRRLDDEGRHQVEVLYHWRLVGGIIKDANGVDVIPATDPAAIPDHIRAKLPAAHLAAYSAGTAIYYISKVTQLNGDLDGGFFNSLKTDRLGVMPIIEARLVAKFGETGSGDLKRFQRDA